MALLVTTITESLPADSTKITLFFLLLAGDNRSNGLPLYYICCLKNSTPPPTSTNIGPRVKLFLNIVFSSNERIKGITLTQSSDCFWVKGSFRQIGASIPEVYFTYSAGMSAI